MVKYCGHYITCQEVPDEIALTLTITRCPHRCPGCHSPWLQEDIGDELTPGELNHLIQQYRDGITCVCFMGDGNDPDTIRHLCEIVKSWRLKTCVYTGGHRNDAEDLGFPLYFKEGEYVEALGGLASETTNQRMWKMNADGKYEDITSWFWRKKE